MTRHVITDGASTYTRISKREARKRWNKGETFYIIAHKMRPGFPFSMGMTIDPQHIKAEWSLTPTYPTVESLFDATVAEFCYYNANCHETGLYAAFYDVATRKVGTR
jgi:hypothetical protein